MGGQKMDMQKSKDTEPNILYLAIKGVIAGLNKEDQKRFLKSLMILNTKLIQTKIMLILH